MRICDPQMPRAQPGRLPMLPASEADRLALFAKALSDPIRITMLHLLEQTEDLCTCEFEGLLDLPQSKVSYHLKVLLDSGLVTRQTYGTWRHYSLARKGILEQVDRMTRIP